MYNNNHAHPLKSALSVSASNAQESGRAMNSESE